MSGEIKRYTVGAFEVAVVPESKLWLLCPDCGERVGSITHLIRPRGIGHTASAGPWYCHGAGCGAGWIFKMNGREIVELERARDRWIPATVTLELPPQLDPITFTLHTFAMAGSEDVFGNGAKYLYEDHQCPINWLRDVDTITFRGDEDPHGLFRFVDIERGHVENQNDKANRQAREVAPEQPEGDPS